MEREDWLEFVVPTGEEEKEDNSSLKLNPHCLGERVQDKYSTTLTNVAH